MRVLQYDFITLLRIVYYILYVIDNRKWDSDDIIELYNAVTLFKSIKMRITLHHINEFGLTKCAQLNPPRIQFKHARKVLQ